MDLLLGKVIAGLVVVIGGLLFKGKRKSNQHKKQINNVANEAHSQRRKNHVKVVEQIDSYLKDAVDMPIVDWVKQRLGSREGTSSSVERKPKGGNGSDTA